MATVGIAEVAVNVVAGHIYRGAVTGAIGPIKVHDGNNIKDPVIVTLRDAKRVFLWEPQGEGRRALLLSGWDGQREVGVTVRDMSRGAELVALATTTDGVA